jgi:hypothetical protein
MVLQKKQFAQFSYNFYLFIIYNFTHKKNLSPNSIFIYLQFLFIYNL